eukprot:CAMPEP_0115520832 /NCGR_PEP_ID=MMETSP0271-20121206/79207_1 /TAXON_ID=71861 /ORGANISM="Scrippsiella trochoidea, Strain CCMP3099" /LENGTH=48 /DNA_ID= /DNA_START= /DNA_END= /DNA_ORIENTATION=
MASTSFNCRASNVPDLFTSAFAKSASMYRALASTFSAYSSSTTPLSLP